MSARWPVLLRFVARELRGGGRRFAVFLFCIMLGVAAIAAVLGTSSALQQSLAEQGRNLLGGDAEFTHIHRRASAAEITLLQNNAERMSEIATMRAMASMRSMAGAPGTSALPALVEIKAIDNQYPLTGELKTSPVISTSRLMKKNDGKWNALVEETLLGRLNVKLGDTINIGQAHFKIIGRILNEPDRLGSGFPVGPRIMIAKKALQDTGLLQPGSLVRWHYRVLLPPKSDYEQVKKFVSDIKSQAPEAGWRIRDRANAAPRLRRFVERVTIFFTFIALASLITGGVGVASSVKSYLDGRRQTIAILKCLGLSGNRVFAIYLTQILFLAMLGIISGLLIGAAIPFILSGILQQYSPLPLEFSLEIWPLAFAAASGLLTALAFALWPLGRARDLAASSLFRDIASPQRRRSALKDIAAIAATLFALAALVIFGIGEQRLAIIFVTGSVLSFALLLALARGLTIMARHVPPSFKLELRLGIGSIARPGSQSPGAVLALGLGLTLLVSLAQVDANLSSQLEARLPERAPAFFFAGIRAPQLEDFKTLAAASPGVDKITTVPMLRGRITGIKGQPVENMSVPEDARWVLRGDRGITYANALPTGSSIISGKWWPTGYKGPPLVSFTSKEASALGLAPGDEISVNIMGRDIRAKIANLRKVDWSSLGINFVMVFTPATLAAAPHTHLATVAVPADKEDILLRRVADKFDNVTALRIREALGTINALLQQFMYAVRLASMVALTTGAVVLAGALAAGMHGRIYEAAILKSLGATRKQLMLAYAAEFLTLGLASGGFALLTGTAIAWGVVSLLMNMNFTIYPGIALLTAALAIIITLMLGFIGAWRALGRKAAPILRAR